MIFIYEAPLLLIVLKCVPKVPYYPEEPVLEPVRKDGL